MAKNFDLEQLEQLAGGDKAFEKELLNMFVEDVGNSINQLAAAISADDVANAREVAHYIKGASANVGAVGMSQTAAQIEKKAKSGSLQGAPSSLRQLQTLQKEVQRLTR
ncbi:Hpt domain-containing protein [Leptothoe kymatousa]|uniref:Hpt domain-containing protein n=1 Tax=Leptothoe kymatousa TAU-MAC 1615 TaxID=2364775 RepID=A0ABS5Y1Y8_9CYAN|nr:Hpt domain-containing protein [Leptothoe kymatousa]MBT9311820.1 Hpt domain-containing protein [Leptothoe kymatousa TAU-MAC 1615]